MPYPPLSQEYEQHFWAATVECLKLLGVGPERHRRALVNGLVSRLEAAGNEQARMLVFNAEPGDVACDLAGLRTDSPKAVRFGPQLHAVAERHLDPKPA